MFSFSWIIFKQQFPMLNDITLLLFPGSELAQLENKHWWSRYHCRATFVVVDLAHNCLDDGPAITLHASDIIDHFAGHDLQPFLRELDVVKEITHPVDRLSILVHLNLINSKQSSSNCSITIVVILLFQPRCEKDPSGTFQHYQKHRFVWNGP